MASVRVMLVMLVVFFVQGEWMVLHPAHLMPWEFVTHAFYHVNWIHLVLNAFVLFQFGVLTEQIIGAHNVLLVLLAGILGGALLHLCSGNPGNLAGMSAGIFAVTMCYAVLRPNERVILFVVRTTMLRAMACIAVVSVVFAIMGTLPGVGHWAHLGGMAMGWLCAQRMKS
jgi:membrane associated rhomboid family serine protease